MTMTAPETRISFIVPTFNRAHFIAESLDAIRAQMEAGDELLVIDDGSTDDTGAVIAVLGPGIRYVRQDNAGKSVALNRALAMTDRPFVWICDDDDVLRPGAVAMLRAALAESGAGFVFGRYTRFREEDGRRIDLGTGYWPDLTAGSLVRHILEDGFVMQNAALVRRSCYEAVGPFDETMLRSLDYEMFVRLTVAVPCAYVDAILFDQRKHEGDRGPARALHAAGESDKVWNLFDRRIFERAHDAVPLAFYQAIFEGETLSAALRAAHLQRAAVNARHDLWGRTLDDLEAASRIEPSRALHAVERAICRRAMAGKHGFAGALTAEACARLRALRRGSALGRELVDAMLAGVLWRLRDVDPRRRAEARRFLRSVGRLGGTAAAVLQRMAGSKGSNAGGQLREREDVRPGASPARVDA